MKLLKKASMTTLVVTLWAFQPAPSIAATTDPNQPPTATAEVGNTAAPSDTAPMRRPNGPGFHWNGPNSGGGNAGGGGNHGGGGNPGGGVAENPPTPPNPSVPPTPPTPSTPPSAGGGTPQPPVVAQPPVTQPATPPNSGGNPSPGHEPGHSGGENHGATHDLDWYRGHGFRWDGRYHWYNDRPCYFGSDGYMHYYNVDENGSYVESADAAIVVVNGGITIGDDEDTGGSSCSNSSSSMHSAISEAARGNNKMQDVIDHLNREAADVGMGYEMTNNFKAVFESYRNHRARELNLQPGQTLDQQDLLEEFLFEIKRYSNQ